MKSWTNYKLFILLSSFVSLNAFAFIKSSAPTKGLSRGFGYMKPKSTLLQSTPVNSQYEQVWSQFKNGIIKTSTIAALLFAATSPMARAEEAPSSVEQTVTSSSQQTTNEFVTTQSGLKYRDIKVGTGDAAIPGQTVRIHYTGWLDGFDSEKKFDSSYDRRTPLAFKVGVGQVISGWDEGILTDFKVGGVRELVIPASLGYGSRGAGGVIPPGATLYFRIEFVGFRK
eukprot:gene18270-21291_t